MSKKIGFILLGAVFLILTWNLIGQILTTLKSSDRLKETIDKLHSLEVKNKELKEKLARVKTNEFVEQQARDKLGLVKEGETLIIIPKEKTEEILGKSKEGVEEKLPNWQGWLKLLWP